MAMRICHHYDAHETGTCETCHTDVVVTPVWGTTIALAPGFDGAAAITTPNRPSVREALATLLGTSVEAITIEDVSAVAGRYYGTATQVRWGLAGSRHRCIATLDSSEQIQKTPARVEYEVADA